MHTINSTSTFTMDICSDHNYVLNIFSSDYFKIPKILIKHVIFLNEHSNNRPQIPQTYSSTYASLD